MYDLYNKYATVIVGWDSTGTYEGISWHIFKPQVNIVIDLDSLHGYTNNSCMYSGKFLLAQVLCISQNRLW